MQRERSPQRVESIDIKQLEIDGLEGFVYSCIDGVLALEDLADLTGLDDEAVAQIVERLVALGAVRWPEERAQKESKGSAAQTDEQVVLDVEEQGYIRELYPRLGELTHYEVLGLQPDADKAAIRHSYFTLSKRFHPDSYFGKNLGTFKSQMEAIFTRLTDAYEVLGKKKKREAYDRYLSRNAAVSAVEHQMERGVERTEAMSGAPTEQPSIEGSPADAAPRRRQRTTTAPGPREDREDMAARARRKRELLERRLRPRAGRTTQDSQAKARSSSMAPPQRVGHKAALRGLTASLKQSAAVTGGVDKVDHQLAFAREAEARGDLATAVTAVRMALAMAPDREGLKEEYRRLDAHLRVQLVDIHKEQANYEEENQMWAAASISWAKVADSCPEDPLPARRAAAALFRAGGDLRKARDYAQRSRDLDPKAVETLVLLGRIYVGAGMDASARKELQAAAKLDPGHEMVKNLLRELEG
jgi:curved DNA-binding protein CbpA